MNKILVAIPAYNEEKILKKNILQINQFMQDNFNIEDFLIVIADNNSQDQTALIAKEITGHYKNIDYIFVGQQGKGMAIKTAWENYINSYDIFIFMDADLATDLSAVPALVAGIKQGNDLVIGSRYLKDSQVERQLLRRLFSFTYRLFLKLFLNTKIKDFPCGFKAVKKEVVQKIMPQIKNLAWFFDTELLYLAEKAGYKIKEIPVKWQEPRTKDDKSRVKLAHVSWQYLKEVWRLRFG